MERPGGEGWGGEGGVGGDREGAADTWKVILIPPTGV